MATYTKVYNNPYPDGWKDGKDGKTPVTADILNNQTETIEAIEQYLEDNPIEQGGGGSGTTDYNDLTNKPSINGTELSGNIMLDIPTKTSDLTNDSGFLTDIKGKNYNDLSDKPQINGIDLQGNLTVEELGLLDITESTDTTLENSKDGVLKIKEIYGNTEQDGTPIPDAPVSIDSSVISEIKVCKKNLFDITTLKPRNSTQGGTVSFNGDVADISSANQSWATCFSGAMHVKVGTPCIFKFKISNYSATTNTYLVLYKGNLEPYSGATIYFAKDGYYTVKTTPTEEVLKIGISSNGSSNNVTNTFTLSEAQLEVGTVATPYEPYTESVVTLSEPITLNGLGDVQDYVDVKRGVLVQKFGTITYKGNESGWQSSSVQGTDSAYFEIGISKKRGFNALCTHFVNGNVYSTNTDIGFSTQSSGGMIRFRPNNVSTMTLATWKEWVANNNMTVIYELATPIETPLPEADVEALKSLKTYDGVTHIFTDSEVEPDWFVEYNTTRVGTELDEIDAELAKINKRITDIGTTAQISYSTEEQVVGTWIDGKPLYQKTIVSILDTLSSTIYNYANNVDEVIDIESMLKIITETGISNFRKVTCASLNSETIIEQSATSEEIYTNLGNKYNDFVEKILYVTIQYTKTTDTV